MSIAKKKRKTLAILNLYIHTEIRHLCTSTKNKKTTNEIYIKSTRNKENDH